MDLISSCSYIKNLFKYATWIHIPTVLFSQLLNSWMDLSGTTKKIVVLYQQKLKFQLE